MNILYKFPKRKLWIAYLVLIIIISSPFIFMISSFFNNTINKNQDIQTEITQPDNPPTPPDDTPTDDTPTDDTLPDDTPTPPNDTPTDEPVIPPTEELTHTEEAFYNLFTKIKTLEEISKDYDETDYQKRVITYIRSAAYSGAWNMILDNVDSNFVTIVKNYDITNNTNLSDLRNYSSSNPLMFTIPSTNEKVDFYHMFAALEGAISGNADLLNFTGWGGDLFELAGSKTPTGFNKEGSVFGPADLCADLDAVNIIANYTNSNNKSLYYHIVEYYKNLTTKSRAQQFKDNIFPSSPSSLDDINSFETIIFNNLETSAEAVGSLAFGFVFGYSFLSKEDIIKECTHDMANYLLTEINS